MPDTKLTIHLTNFEEKPLRDIPTEVTFFDNRGDQVGDTASMRFPTGEADFNLEGFARGQYRCRVAAQRYEEQGLFFFVAGRRKSIQRTLILPRNARAENPPWNARFNKWASLGADYRRFKDLLKASPRLELKDKDTGNHASLGRLTASTYEDDDPRPLREAKAGLLNMYAKMSAISPPRGNESSWWSALDELLVIQRDRVIGLANPTLTDLIRRIQRKPGLYPYYGRAPATLHRKNILAGVKVLGLTAQESDVKLQSVKTKEKYGVLQLTLGEVNTREGQTVTILDADVDENGDLLKHFGDMISHKFNGGTHPFHVYDILHRISDNPLLGYSLV